MKNTTKTSTDRKQKRTTAARTKTKKTQKAKPAIAYQNKDIASKTFTEMFPKSFPEVCGISLLEIVKVHSLNLPAVSANELRIDTLFELADGSFAIVDYESTYREQNKIKYLDYVVRILRRQGPIKLRVLVLYTADITPAKTKNSFNAGAVQLQIEESFLSELDSSEIRQRLSFKICHGEKLTDSELAKHIENEKTQVFLLAGMMVFTDKVIDRSDADQIRRWIMMTKVEKIIAKEKADAVREATKSVARANALAFLKEGIPIEKIARCITVLSKEEIEDLAKTVV